MENKPSETTTERLAVHECWSLLRLVSVGRLAVWVGDGPDIFPINYTTDHGTIVFRTGSGTKLEGALGDYPVAMEADGVNPETGVAWSVVIRGKAELLTETKDVLDTFSLPLFPWQAGKKDHFVRVMPDSISGRRFSVAAPKTWWTPIQGTKPTASE
ncbi:pyridoxamine 5'-phosphate oxidase family protein [Pseudarthrobacter sp. RMG13]|uniref:Pyridoxamine 5'-phosphate oxidase family protein n=1 Tax=Pseudarthrobacter humi TaxID=2952523 RepID=A0ABT1LK65_9MICC|nr:pyridoxamine 5'-phosphate oxidase family protein [Pseudarthrobacter humi]MCP8998491.1 pyridoxamine 5'-phosphate oxidase family protein [Pseudarthrobacter humi]